MQCHQSLVHYNKLKKTLSSSASLKKAPEVLAVKEYQRLMKELKNGMPWPSATVLLTAMHNIVTESISTKFYSDIRRGYYCPSTLVRQLKAGIYSKDKLVQDGDLKALVSLPQIVANKQFKIAGLAPDHELAACNK